MGFSHTTWTTPPIHEHSGVGLPRATLTYGKGTRHPAGGKRNLQGGGGFGSAEYGSKTGFNGKLLVFPEPDRFRHVWQGILKIDNIHAFIFILRSARYLRPKFGYPLGDGLFWIFCIVSYAIKFVIALASC